MWEQIELFLNNNIWLKIILEGYLIFIIVSLVVYIMAYTKRAFYLVLTFLLFVLAIYISKQVGMIHSEKIYQYLTFLSGMMLITLLTPEFRKLTAARQDIKDTYMSASEQTKHEIADATMYLASKKIGALITMERHNSLDQFAEKAIQLNSDVSKELLINIFTPNTPLHDGAVIIRGNKIRCAGAYYVLTQHEELDKTTGSRHRAGLGISEVTDSLTIIVSEETGNVSIATEGFFIKITDKEKLMSYLDMFIEKSR